MSTQQITQREANLRLAADIGGTFTDIVLANDKTGEFSSIKVLTTTHFLTEGIMKGFNSILNGDYSQVANIVHGTTAGLNAVIEKTGARCGLVVTKGFRDVYEIGRGNRVEMYNCQYKKPCPLVPRKDIFEVDERVMADGTILKGICEIELAGLVQRIKDANYEAIAICFLNSYVNPENEHITANYFKKHLDNSLVVVTSYETAPECREYERISTTVLNAYIAPKTRNHLMALQEELKKSGYNGNLYVMQSSGGVMKAEAATSCAVQTLMSGPVGGTIGATSYKHNNMIAIDMGGTSFDVSLIVNGKVETTVESVVEGFPLLSSTVNVSSIGAGGGSIAWTEANGMRVGPHSAGAHPGPVCYGQGGKRPTVTDANVVLGFMDADSFLTDEMKLDVENAKSVFVEYGARHGIGMCEAAEGVYMIANHMMADAIREITVRRGIDPREFTLLSYGGAGPMHAAAIAEELEIKEIMIPVVPGTFSAWGMLQADIRHDLVRTVMCDTHDLDINLLEKIYISQQQELIQMLTTEGFTTKDAKFERSFDIRYVGQEYTITIDAPGKGRKMLTDVTKLFHQTHERLYGHANINENIELVNARLTVTVPTKKIPLPKIESSKNSEPKPMKVSKGFFNGVNYDMKIYQRDMLNPWCSVKGPAVIIEPTSTTVVRPEWTLLVDANKSMVLQHNRE